MLLNNPLGAIQDPNNQVQPVMVQGVQPNQNLLQQNQANQQAIQQIQQLQDGHLLAPPINDVLNAIGQQLPLNPQRNIRQVLVNYGQQFMARMMNRTQLSIVVLGMVAEYIVNYQQNLDFDIVRAVLYGIFGFVMYVCFYEQRILRIN
eukprot:403353830